ncbi:uncharacterized protein LOC121882784 [Scomber scombrus]|uniref:Uncharacterized protein LOC121882784 n=1 Tax=Scomber scombrus TaxID=13677 RepID=A0AAV1PCZ4_SCOSC
MYFCKGVCSGENILIQSEKKKPAISRRGRYSMEIIRWDGVFNVTIKRLKKADAGEYHCAVEENFKVLIQEVNLQVLDASTVPPGSPSSTTILQTETETLPQGSFLPSAEPSPAAVTLPTTVNKTNQKAARGLTDTTVVIIVSGDYSEEEVRLQSLEPDPESSAQDASQYAAIYQALDPKTLD